ncbi:OadG family protein, partial [Paramuribaculum intestinale]
DSGEVIAAISMALAEHSGHGHDMEDTILTIRRMRKAYSPWNSKIYNMRHIQEHSKSRPSGKI